MAELKATPSALLDSHPDKNSEHQLNLMNFTKTETILSPFETSMSVECWILDSKHILTPNYDNEYVFTFQPVSQHDYGMISEAVMTALQKVEIRTMIEAKDCTETPDGMLKCSQLFAPKINKEIKYPEMDFLYKQVSLKIHLRDDVANRVFLQCDYIDFYEEDTRTQYQIECEENPLPPDDIDF